MKQIKLISIRTKNLKKKQIISICKLKNKYWRWTVISQLKWFVSHVKTMDINNLLYLKKELVGYTLLRKRKAYHGKKKIKYFYLDTIIILSRFRKTGLGSKLMNHNNKIINKYKKHAFLICQKKNISFYSKHKWKVLKKNSFNILDHQPAWFNKNIPLFGMVYNQIKTDGKINYFLNKT